MTYFVYILECSDKTFYIGSTSNLAKRVHQHNNTKNAARYTKIRRPVTLVYAEELKTYSQAREREAYLKRLPRLKKESLVTTKQNHLLLLSKRD